MMIKEGGSYVDARSWSSDLCSVDPYVTPTMADDG
jgi:hypothetical protein